MFEKTLVRQVLQRGFAKSITSSGRDCVAMIIEDPLPLEHVKGAWTCFEAGCMFLPSLRRLGARSVYMHHTVFHRALAEAAEVYVPATTTIVLR